MLNTANPSATYLECSLFRRCRLSLFTDRIELRGSRILSFDFEAVVRLAVLSPDVTRIRMRHSWWLAGLLMQVVPCSAFCILQGGRNLEHGFSVSFIAIVWAFAAAFFGSGTWLLVAGFPKKEFVVFRNQTGTIAFDVGRAGPDHPRFDEFIATIQLYAELCRSTANGPAS